jgi:hypothetical protein
VGSVDGNRGAVVQVPGRGAGTDDAGHAQLAGHNRGVTTGTACCTPPTARVMKRSSVVEQSCDLQVNRAEQHTCVGES